MNELRKRLWAASITLLCILGCNQNRDLLRDQGLPPFGATEAMLIKEFGFPDTLTESGWRDIPTKLFGFEGGADYWLDDQGRLTLIGWDYCQTSTASSTVLLNRLRESIEDYGFEMYMARERSFRWEHDSTSYWLSLFDDSCIGLNIDYPSSRLKRR